MPITDWKLKIETRPRWGVLKNRVLWLMAFRMATATLLVGTAAFIHLRGGWKTSSLSIISIYILVGTSFLVTLLSLVALRLVKKIDRFANVQIAVDVLHATALIYVTGGIDSTFPFLYIFVIIWAGIVLYGKGVFLTASLSSILYGALLDFQYYEYIPRLENLFGQPQTYSDLQILYKIFINIAAFYMVAFLSNYLFAQLRRTGERLKEKEIDYEKLDALNKKIVQEIGSGLMTIDRDGFITSFNRAAEDITGFTLREVYEIRVDDIFPGMMGRLLDYKKGIVSRKRAWRWETPYRNRRGDVMHLGFSVSSLKDLKGEEVGSIIIFQNLTHYKEMEEAVRRAERLSAVGKLAAGMAHEIRNPLASMSGSIQVLRNELDISEENRRLMDIILRESERLNRLITEFLDYARPYKPKKDDVDLSRMIAETLDFFEKGLSRGQRVTVKREIMPGISLYGEQERLKEVLWNLLNNAIQSMPEGGELSVSLKNSGEAAVMAVRDTGEGIEEKDLARVFEPFFTTKTYGTGLGLATVYRVIEGHGGEVRVESEKGKGTSFTVILPVKGREG